MATISPPSPSRHIPCNRDLRIDTRRDLGTDTIEVLDDHIPDTNTISCERLLKQLTTYVQDPATKDQPIKKISHTLTLFQEKIEELGKSNRLDPNLKKARNIMKEDAHLLITSVLFPKSHTVSKERTPSSSSSSNSTSITSTPSSIGQMVKDITGNSSSVVLRQVKSYVDRPNTQSKEKIAQKLEVFHERIKVLEKTKGTDEDLEIAKRWVKHPLVLNPPPARLNRPHIVSKTRTSSGSTSPTSPLNDFPSRPKTPGPFPVSKEQRDTLFAPKRSSSENSISALRVKGYKDFLRDQLSSSLISTVSSSSSSSSSTPVENEMDGTIVSTKTVDSSIGTSSSSSTACSASISSASTSIASYTPWDITREKALDSLIELIELVKTENPAQLKLATDKLPCLQDLVEVRFSNGTTKSASIGALILSHLTMIHLNKGSISFESLDRDYGIHAFANSDGHKAYAEERVLSIIRTTYEIIFEGLYVQISGNTPFAADCAAAIKAVNRALSQLSEAIPELEQFNECLNTTFTLDQRLSKAIELHQLVKQRWEI